MFIGSERCISTTLLRSKRRLQARRDKPLGRIADCLRLMTRGFKCSFSTTGQSHLVWSPSFRCFFIARQCCDKIRLPGLAAVSGKRLFYVVGIRSNVRPYESNKDSPPVG